MTLKKGSKGGRGYDYRNDQDGAKRAPRRDLHEKHARNAFRANAVNALERFVHEDEDTLPWEEKDELR